MMFLALALQQQQVGGSQEFHELLIDRVGLVANFSVKVLDEFLKHLTKDLKLDFVDGSQNLDGDGLVNGEHWLNQR